MSKTIKLLPCPFCGGHKVTTFGPYGWNRLWGISHSCKSFYNGSQEMFQGFHTEALAIAAWNQRTPPTIAGDTEIVEAAWNALKERVCADPPNAKRCVMVSSEDFSAALSTALPLIRSQVRGEIAAWLRDGSFVFSSPDAIWQRRQLATAIEAGTAGEIG